MLNLFKLIHILICKKFPCMQNNSLVQKSGHITFNVFLLLAWTAIICETTLSIWKKSQQPDILVCSSVFLSLHPHIGILVWVLNQSESSSSHIVRGDTRTLTGVAVSVSRIESSSSSSSSSGLLFMISFIVLPYCSIMMAASCSSLLGQCFLRNTSTINTVTNMNTMPAATAMAPISAVVNATMVRTETQMEAGSDHCESISMG